MTFQQIHSMALNVHMERGFLIYITWVNDLYVIGVCVKNLLRNNEYTMNMFL